jgi:diaminopimelate decarboxylase
VETLNNLFPITAGRSKAGHLTITGHVLRPLAEQYGTPLYLYDGATIRNQVKRLREQLENAYPGMFEITYAAKAYFSPGIARHLTELDLGVDVVSLGELMVARRAGFAANRVHLHGNNKAIEELRAALEWGVQAIVVDSLEELEILEGLAAEMDRTARIWLRISPGVAVDSHAYLQTAHHTSKFGLPVQGGAAAEAIRRAKASKRLHLSGIHTHLGSQFFDAAPYRQAIASLMALAAECGFIPEELSPGGGWGVPYIPDQPEGDPALWIQAVTGAVVEECQKRGWPLPRLVVEPGRWLVARSGVTVYTVGTTKTAGDGTCFVAVDGGMADNPRPALYQARYSACLAEHPDEPPDQQVNLVGRYCETGDQLIPEVWLPETKRGDLLVMPVTGAYQLSMASNYNLVPRPAVLWLEEGRVEVLQPRERIEDSPWWNS